MPPVRPGGSAHPARHPGAARAQWSGALLGVKILAAALSALIVIGSGVAWNIYRDFANNVHVVAVNGPVDENGNPVEDVDGEDLNILIVGDDSREGATPQELEELGTTDTDSPTDNTDTIMIMHVPASGEAASVMSFPRDSWVEIPGHDEGKINSVFSYGKADADGNDSGGASLLGQVIYDLTGLRMDHFVKIGMLGFLRVANAIGGVDLCLNSKMGLEEDSDAEHPDGYTGIDLQEGWNRDVKGHQAIAFVRQRHGLPGGDIDRVHRQQYFLAAAFRKIQSAGTLLNPFKLKDLVSAVSSSLTVDDGLSGTGLLSLATQMSALTAGNLSFRTAPNDGGGYRDDIGLDVVTLDQQQLRADIAAFIGHSDAYTDAGPADPRSVSVQVVNNTNGSDAGDEAIAALTALGFRATAKPSPDVSATTTIAYPAGQEAQAKALAAVVPGASVLQSDDVSGVTLVLGNDGAAVTAATGGSGGSGGGTGGGSGGGTSGSGGSAPAPADPTPGVRSGDDADCVD